MTRMTRAGMLAMGVAMLAGCRTAAHRTEMPRVDLEVENTGGNRGYLVGTPPAAGAGKTTRQMLQTDIEIPSFYKAKPGGRPADLESGAGTAVSEPVQAAGAAPGGPYDTYVVQKGDSLWSIAGKPEIYGKASAWRRIYDANRDLLKSPDRLKAGMTLKIPRGAGGASGKPEETRGSTYSK